MGLQPLRDHLELQEKAARWFSDKWGIPAAAYHASIGECIARKTGIPQWYAILDERREIVAGAGVIENDFHDRKDLTPNLCALFVEETCRGRGLARKLLDFIREEMREQGFPALYLVTDLTDFYEKCDWRFLTTATGDDGNPIRIYVTE
ncbi:GNAT family N-acetyltransferase [Alistipes sp. D31t1_170403_E11]|uniref:GNAT family N-acetyltransferase n=1 Tax=Alistipes sp. D31t1_170403_E11 TaxID=2787128 RepID=UPI001897781C|nr:GNAT family N-acetyltransferase [Alistipes sp. D31t1_170403_E11]